MHYNKFFSPLGPLVVLALLCVGGVGCGPSLSYVVPQDLLQRLPKSSQRSVFQARTVVTIAIDRMSSINRQIDNIQNDIRKTQAKIEEVAKQRSAASGADVAKFDLETDMLEAKIDFLDESLDHQHLRLKLADRELLLAKGQFELAKAKLVKKHSIAFDDEVEDFERQVKDIQEWVNDFRKDVDEDAAHLKREEDRWLEAKKRYYGTIGESTKGWWTEQ